ncbi:putative Protein phosphatase 2A regulatory subunit [Giardia muris]|uniref:EF-hand domain-containing protein n=1 Tax=Giardia muris TaxID=5742 RepID=A0A4Z1T7F4_GIAMU|nr:putative Protein phosphatase 2A regulatory subunit [Giardia muris]|eukprot:TNJ30013.1 putative Protein phosphatase 2A regulatory subunit [Giardia muris]
MQTPTSNSPKIRDPQPPAPEALIGELATSEVDEQIVRVAQQLAEDNQSLVCTELNKMASLSSCTLSPSITTHVLNLLDTVIEGCPIGDPITAVEFASPSTDLDLTIPRSPAPKSHPRLSTSGIMRSPGVSGSSTPPSGPHEGSPARPSPTELYKALSSPLFSPVKSPQQAPSTAASVLGVGDLNTVETAGTGGIYEEPGEALRNSCTSMSFLTSSKIEAESTALSEEPEPVDISASEGKLQTEEDYSLHYARVELHLEDAQIAEMHEMAQAIPDLRLKYHIKKPLEQEIVRSCKFCFDTYRCNRLKVVRSSSPDFCKTCTERTQFELNCLNRLTTLFPTGMSFFSVVDADLLGVDLAADYLRVVGDHASVFEVSTDSFLVKCIATMAGMTETAFRKDVMIPYMNTLKQKHDIAIDPTITIKSTKERKTGGIAVLPELICEGIFGLPGFLAFSLFAKIRSEYRHLHPRYLNNIEKFPVPEAIRAQTLLDAPAENNIYHRLVTYKAVTQDEEGLYSVTVEQIRAFYSEYIIGRSTPARLFACLKLGKASSIVEEDLMALMAGVCRYHPALEFLRATPEFQVQYSITVVTRIFYLLDRTFKNNISLHDLVVSKLVNTLWLLQREPDINRVLKYFSYEHFYVIFCKFWELDTDHDQYISEQDLCRYGIHTCPFPFVCKCGKTDGTCTCNRVYNSRAVARIFAQIPRPFVSTVPGKMCYKDFIPFILAEEDKDSDPALDYFFALMDVDEDNYISTSDIMYFWPVMEQMYHCHKRDTNRQRDVMCQMVDMAKHTQYCVGNGFAHQDQRISKRDIRRCKTQGNLFNVFFNFTKAVQFECKDPYTIRYSPHMFEKTTWERFARVIYDSLEGMEEAAQETTYEDPEPVADEVAPGGPGLDAEALEL